MLGICMVYAWNIISHHLVSPVRTCWASPAPKHPSPHHAPPSPRLALTKLPPSHHRSMRYDFVGRAAPCPTPAMRMSYPAVACSEPLTPST
eukprot:scaffold72416_cov23-Phaeocystis_antarctica.AAC.2